MGTLILYKQVFVFIVERNIITNIINMLENITLQIIFVGVQRKKRFPRISWQETCVCVWEERRFFYRRKGSQPTNQPTGSHYIYITTTSKKKSNYILLACNLIHLRMLTKMLTYKTFLISFHCVWLPFFTIIRASAHMISLCCFFLFLFFCHIESFFRE